MMMMLASFLGGLDKCLGFRNHKIGCFFFFRRVAIVVCCHAVLVVCNVCMCVINLLMMGVSADPFL